MPFSPFHLGPGVALKAVGGRHFSFMVFGGTQVLMDLEPLIGLIQGWTVLHGYSHTLAGALVIGSIAGLSNASFHQILFQIDYAEADRPELRASMLTDYKNFAAELGVVSLPADFDITEQVAINTRNKWLARNQGAVISWVIIVSLLILSLIFLLLGWTRKS